MIIGYDIEYIPDNQQGRTGRDFRLIMEEYPLIKGADLVYNEREIPGRNGELVQSSTYRKNLTIPVKLTLLAPPEDQMQYREYIRKIKRWLTGPGWLRLSDDDYKYRVLKIQWIESKRKTPRYGFIEASFLVKPYEYKMDGLLSYPVSEIKYNACDESKPIYYITGESTGTLTVNGNTITINVGQNLVIDTDLELTYRMDNGTNISEGITGNYRDLYLVSGNNSISASGVNAQIKPMWGYNV